jgi:TRAP-type C4-dicarboxylate transport system permease small subunit
LNLEFPGGLSVSRERIRPRRGPVLKIVTNVLDVLCKITEITTNLCMAALFVVVNLGVFSRYVFLSPFIWTEELALFILAWMVFLAGSQVIRKWENVRVTYFIEKLPPKLTAIIEMGLKLLILCFLVYVLILGSDIIPKVGPTEIAPALGISMLIPQMSLVVGGFLMVIQMLGIIVETLAPLFMKGRS